MTPSTKIVRIAPHAPRIREWFTAYTIVTNYSQSATSFWRKDIARRRVIVRPAALRQNCPFPSPAIAIHRAAGDSLREAVYDRKLGGPAGGRTATGIAPLAHGSLTVSIQHLVESKIEAAWPVEDWQEVTVLVAVSGGGDSVALLRALSNLKRTGAGRIVVEALQPSLRAHADADEQFVAELAKALGHEVDIGRARTTHRHATPGAGNGRSEEAYSRGSLPIARGSRANRGIGMSSRPTRPTIRPKPSCTACCAGRAWRVWGHPPRAAA